MSKRIGKCEKLVQGSSFHHSIYINYKELFISEVLPIEIFTILCKVNQYTMGKKSHQIFYLVS